MSDTQSESETQSPEELVTESQGKVLHDSVSEPDLRPESHRHSYSGHPKTRFTKNYLHRYLIDKKADRKLKSASFSGGDINGDVRVCSNCNKKGHIYKACSKPIISCGIIAYRRIGEGGVEYLSIARKNSISYIDILRGKYKCAGSVEYILKLLSNMTYPELHRLIVDRDFERMWRDASLMYLKRASNVEYEKALAKMTALWNGFTVITSDNTVEKWDLYKLVQSIDLDALPKSTGWGFPKGRRNKYENDLQCAMREFHEETGYKVSGGFRMAMTPGSNKLTRITELFTGINGFLYEYRYFVAELISDLAEPGVNTVFQKAEISCIGWFTYKDLRERYIRPELVSVLDNIQSVLISPKT